MDWTFWVGAVVIVALVVVTQVFLHESRWSRRPREDEPEHDDPGAGDPDGAEDADPAGDDRRPGE
ncbi:hypothetical protein [Agromyces arachidis]|uniref:hypothetical protein n=1 Tax=Agromyces arachidis TaxID=766966 RepID=UPI004057444A